MEVWQLESPWAKPSSNWCRAQLVAYFYCRFDALSELLLGFSDLDDAELARLKKSAERIRRSRD